MTLGKSSVRKPLGRRSPRPALSSKTLAALTAVKALLSQPSPLVSLPLRRWLGCLRLFHEVSNDYWVLETMGA